MEEKKCSKTNCSGNLDFYKGNFIRAKDGGGIAIYPCNECGIWHWSNGISIDNKTLKSQKKKL